MKDIGATGPMRPISVGVPDKPLDRLRFEILQSTAIRQVSQNSANLNSVHASSETPHAIRSTGRAETAYALLGKRLLDLFLVLVSAPITLPVIGFGALFLWIEGGRPFYRQDRIGKDGKVFSILKLRTMVRDADARLAAYLAEDPELRKEWDETQKLKKDPRITPVGNILRATSMDELPQLWNVLTGEMSLVGPRPMMTDQAGMYGDSRYYDAVRPGITGIWQVSDRNDSAFVTRRDADEEYFFSMSLVKDLILLTKTFGAVVRRTGY